AAGLILECGGSIFAAWPARAAVAAATGAAVGAASAAAAARAAVAVAAAMIAVMPAFVAFLAAFAGGRADWLRIGLAQLLHRRFARQLDAAGVVDKDYLHLDLVADVDEILDALDIAIRKL